jgi:hypothetical protein
VCQGVHPSFVGNIPALNTSWAATLSGMGEGTMDIVQYANCGLSSLWSAILDGGLRFFTSLRSVQNESGWCVPFRMIL